MFALPLLCLLTVAPLGQVPAGLILAALIRDHPDLPIEIEGHTDSVGTRAYNARLSRERAEAVKRWLAANGSVRENRMTTRGFGPTRPVAPNGTAEGRQQNRRVEVRLRK